jgi:hypothetical protein
MPVGYVYVLVNPALKGQVKIGKTSNSPEQRAADLSGTGLPHQFVVVYSERVSDCEKVERLLHEKLAEFRVSPNREFFRIRPEQAVRAVLEVIGPYQVEETGSSDGRLGNKPLRQVQEQKNFPSSFDVYDQQTQARLQEEKRLRRILLKRNRANAQAQG